MPNNPKNTDPNQQRRSVAPLVAPVIGSDGQTWV